MRSFHKKLIINCLILLIPVCVFILFLYKEVILGVFLIPVLILTLLPCGVTSFLSARNIYKEAVKEMAETVQMIAVFQMLIAFIMSAVGILGILLMILLVMPE
jgi:hypothetical protein